MRTLRWSTKCVTMGLSIISIILILCVPLHAEVAKISLWSSETTPENRVGLETMLKEFHDKHPNVKVEVSVIKWPDIMLKALAAYTVGNEPDIMITGTSAVLDFWQLGALDPVDEIIQKIGEEDYFEPVLAGVKYKEHYMAVPFWNEPGGIFYKKHYFQEKGLEIPQTWDKWVQVSEALTEDLDGDGTIDRYGLLLPGQGHYVNQFMNEMLWKNGTSVWNEDGDLNFGRRTVEALDFYVKLFKEFSSPGSIEYGFAELYEMLGREEVASEQTLGHSMKRIIEEYPEIQDKIGVFPTPYNEPFSEALWQGCAGPTAYIVFRGARHKDRIAELILFLLKPENVAYWSNCRPIGQIPATRSALELTSFWENPKVARHKDIVQTLVKIVENQRGLFAYHGPHPFAGRVYGSLVVPNMFQKVVLDGWSSKKAVEWGANEILRITGGAVKWVGKDQLE